MRIARRQPSAPIGALSSLGVLLTLTACRGAEAEEPAPAPVAEAVGAARPTDTEVDAQVIGAVRDGNYARAHGLLEHLLLERYLAEARSLIEADPPNPQDGLLWLDKALAVDDSHGPALLLHAEGNFLLAEQMIARGSQGVYITGAFEDAFSSFKAAVRSAPDDPRALFGASRAAYNLLFYDEALSYANRGMEVIEAGADASRVSPAPERIVAEVTYMAYANAVATDGVGTGELFASSEASLERLVGLDASDPWVWSTLANLYLWEERTEDAKSALKRGLDRAPEDDGLITKLVEISTANGGPEAAILDITTFVNKHPEVAAGSWWLGRSRFDLACEELSGDSPSAGNFEAAERAFARARELDPALEASCKGYETVCRSGIGNDYLRQDELDSALEAFLSMNELLPRGMEWDYPDRGIASGLWGLHRVGWKHSENGDLDRAAEVYEILRKLQPDNADWANNAGFFHRDDAVALELLGRDLCRRSANPPEESQEIARLLEEAGLSDPRENGGDLGATLHDRADELLAQARTAIDKCAAAYREAARLAPDDVRIVNDTALILVYYANRDLDDARQLLERCIEMGTEQLADETLGDDVLMDLENALGDAYENMGFLYLVRLREPEKARPFLQKCLELGDPRPKVTGQLLPLCDEDPDHPSLVEWRSWGEPCTGETEGKEPVR